MPVHREVMNIRDAAEFVGKSMIRPRLPPPNSERWIFIGTLWMIHALR
jgi:hypothetical protein